MLKATPIFLLMLILIGCNSRIINNHLELKRDKNYPRWLKNNKYRTDQTSGIIFIGNNENGDKQFLLADDIGKIHRLVISHDTNFTFHPVYFTQNVVTFLDTFPKADFEDITLDKQNNQVYLSIEGDGKLPDNFVGIYALKFKHDEIVSDTIEGIKRLHIKPDSLFYKYVKNNIGYEGLAVDENYFYLGYEGFIQNGIFADSSVIFVVNKHSLNIVKQIFTKPLDIYTVCGLYSDKNNSLFGIDRNNKTIFHLNFDVNLEVKNVKHSKVETVIPAYSQYDYVGALESITMDDNDALYLTDDPYKKYFVPSGSILNKLDSLTIRNFKNFVPIIYRFNLSNYKGE